MNWLLCWLFKHKPERVDVNNEIKRYECTRCRQDWLVSIFDKRDIQEIIKKYPKGE